MSRPQILLTAAPSGTGKSYRRGAYFLVEEFLPDHEGVHCSNFPLNLSAIAAYMEAKSGKPAAEFAKRIELIPQAVLETWAAGKSGPWEYFKDVDINGWHIAIDECHNFCGERHDREHIKKWQAWVGELRHRGATVEFLTQHEDKLHKSIKDEAVLLLAMVKSDERRDPFFKVPLADWYELRAGFTGEYESAVWQVEHRRVRKSWVQSHASKFRFEQKYFDLYDSFNAPVVGEGSKGTGPNHVYLRLSRFRLVLWFLRRNWWPVGSRVGGAIVFAWLCLGGFKPVTAWGHRALTESMAKGKPAVETPGLTGTPTPADPVATAVDLRKQLNETQEALRIASQKADQAERLARLLGEKLQESYTLVMMGVDHIVFANGEVVRLSEKIEGGPYGGRYLSTMDFPRRRAFLDNGQVLVLGSKPSVDLSALDAIPSPKVAPIVPGTAGPIPVKPVTVAPVADVRLNQPGVPTSFVVDEKQPSDAEVAKRLAELQKRLSGTSGSGGAGGQRATEYTSGVDLGNGYAAPNIPTVRQQSNGPLDNRGAVAR